MNFGLIFNAEAFFKACEIERGADLLEMLKGSPHSLNERKALTIIGQGFKSDNTADMLTWAALRGRTEIVKALLDKKLVDVNARDEYGDTALINASYGGHLDTIKALHKHGADGSIMREGYKAAAYYAASGGHPDALELLSTLYPEKTATPSKPKAVQTIRL